MTTTTRPQFRNAITDCITAAEQGATINHLNTIATVNKLTPSENKQLAMTLITAKRLGLIKAPPGDRTPFAHARESD